MKVKVKVKHAPLNQVEYFLNEALSEALADLDAAHQEIEKLFQENKDLRVQEGHTQDELKQLKSRFATACAERDNWEASFKQMTGWWEQAIDAKTKVEQELNSTQIELADRDERVFILEQRIETLEQENKELRETTDNLSAKVKTYESTITWAKLNTAQEEITRLQEEVTRLTTERDNAVKENTTLIFRNSDLKDELDAVINIKNEYAEQITSLRAKCKTLNKKANDTTAGFWNFLVEHGLVKTEEELGGNHNEAEH